MFQKVLHKIRTDGPRGTLSHYGNSLALKMSTNYRQNPARFESMNTLQFIGFVFIDYVRKMLDRVTEFVDHALTNRNELDREALEEFTVRLLHPDLLDENSIVYAFGVSRHIETEEDIVERIGATVHMFDPTQPAIEFIEKREANPKLVFDPIGVWTETGPVRFYSDRRSWTKNLSVVNMYHTDDYIEAPCYTLNDIMERKNHDRIDLLKMDIEGSALPILIHMFEETTLRPPQIVGALERPHFVFNASLKEVVGYLMSKLRLFKLLKKEKYQIITHNNAEFTAVRS